MLRFAVAVVVVVIQACAFSLILKCHFLSLLGHMAKFINREQDCLQHRKVLPMNFYIQDTFHYLFSE